METIELKYAAIHDALLTLKESLDLLKDPALDALGLRDQLRDSVIKRFEYSMDTFWKYLREYLEHEHAIVFSKITLNAIFRECLNVQLINQNDFDKLLAMTEDRNNTSHAYNEELAEAISGKVYGYYDLMNAVVEITKK